MGSEEGREDVVVVPELGLLGIILVYEFGEAPGDLCFRGQRVIVEILAHVALAFGGALQAVAIGLLAGVIPLAIGVQVINHAQIGLADRVIGKLGLELLLEPGIEAFGFSLLGRGGGVGHVFGDRRLGGGGGRFGFVGRRAGCGQGQGAGSGE